MKKRIYSLLLASVLCIGMLTGCGLEDPPAESRIVEDVNAFGIDAIEEDDVVITDCEIIKRQTNEDEKEDVVYCRLFSEEGYCQSEYQFKLTYNYYDEGGWILDMAEPEREDTWVQLYVDENGNDIMDKVVWFDHEYHYEEAEFQGMELPIIVCARDYGLVDPVTGENIVKYWESGWESVGYFQKNMSGNGYAMCVQSDAGAYLVNEKGEQISNIYETMETAGYIKGEDGTRINLYAGGIGSVVYVMNDAEEIYCTVPGMVDRNGKSSRWNQVYFKDIDIGTYRMGSEDGEFYEGLIDLKGNIIVPATVYESIGYAAESDCFVVRGKGDRDNTTGTMDKKGNIILPLEYSDDEIWEKVGDTRGAGVLPEKVQAVADAADMQCIDSLGDRYLLQKRVYKEAYGTEIDVYSMVDEKGNVLIDQFEGNLHCSDSFGESVRAVTWDAEYIFYYDMDGVQRTPKLQYVCGEYTKKYAMDGIMHTTHDLFSYKGILGVFTE